MCEFLLWHYVVCDHIFNKGWTRCDLNGGALCEDFVSLCATQDRKCNECIAEEVPSPPPSPDPEQPQA